MQGPVEASMLPVTVKTPQCLDAVYTGSVKTSPQNVHLTLTNKLKAQGYTGYRQLPHKTIHIAVRYHNWITIETVGNVTLCVREKERINLLY